MDFLKALAVFFISPFNVAVFLTAAGFIAQRTERTRAAKRCWLAASVIVLIFSQRYVSDVLLYPLEHMPTLNKADNIKPELIFTPGCYFNTEGDVSTISRWSECSLQRLVQASILARRHDVPVIVTGGHFLADRDVSYAHQAETFLLELGMNENKIKTVGKGTTTQTEIDAIGPLIKNKSVMVVSSATHATRLKMMMVKEVREYYFYPVDFHSSGKLKPYISLPSIDALESSRSALYEYVAILKAIVLS
ncbi:YdcF family protein [Alteromonas aestuariivivens]|uniref:YdcF family protein n=1 Tax=Alteromonas aestuariivivens TaxID=1938339 RepID=A0A3D8MEB0_9ALTE|nr:YdcF family protein [Alteromonas aestuariivivens]RDV29209.1 YdcF family protein [Alteromonas aestuariivivens]